MDDLTLLAELGRSLEHEPPATLARQRGGLAPRRRAPNRWALVAAAAATAVSVVVPVVLASGGDRSVPASPSPGPKPPEATDPATWPLGTPRPDWFVFVESRETRMLDSGPVTSTERRWLSVDGTRDGWVWRTESGEPTPTPGPQRENNGCADGRREQGGGFVKCTPNPGYASYLPTTAAGVGAYLEARHFPNPKTTNAQKRFAGGLSLNYLLLVPASSRKALFEAMAAASGVTRTPHTRDLAGRQAVSLARISGEATGAEHELFFDPRTYAFLGLRLIHTKGSATRPPNSLGWDSTVLRVAYVSGPGVVP